MVVEPCIQEDGAESIDNNATEVKVPESIVSSEQYQQVSQSQTSTRWTVPESLILTSFDRQSHLHHLLTEKVTNVDRKPAESQPTLPALKLPDGQSSGDHHVKICRPSFQKREIEAIALLDLHSFLFPQNTCGQD